MKKIDPVQKPVAKLSLLLIQADKDILQLSVVIIED